MFLRLLDGKVCAGMREEVRGLRSTNRWLQNSHGVIKSSIGNGVGKECILTTQGNEQLVEVSFEGKDGTGLRKVSGGN